MSERLPLGRSMLLSTAVHAGALGVLAAVLATVPGVAPAVRVEAVLVLPAVLDDPIPSLDGTADAALPTMAEATVPPDLVEAAAAAEEDPRFGGAGAGEPGASPDAPGVVGLGGGGQRVRPRRASASAAPSPETAPEPAAPPVLPDVRARPVVGACPGPAYPGRERRLGVEGVVEVLVRVAADGTVESAEVAATSGAVALDEAAVAAVCAWRFEPASAAGVPVPDTVIQRVRFRLVSAVAGRTQ